MKETGGTMAQARLVHNAMWEVVREELGKGHKVETPFGLFELAISGTVPHVDSKLDPKKNKVYVKITPPAAWRRELAKLTPVVVGGPESELMVAEVFTGAIGAKGYNVITSGQSFVCMLAGTATKGKATLAVAVSLMPAFCQALPEVERSVTMFVAFTGRPTAADTSRG